MSKWNNCRLKYSGLGWTDGIFWLINRFSQLKTVIGNLLMISINDSRNFNLEDENIDYIDIDISRLPQIKKQS